MTAQSNGGRSSLSKHRIPLVNGCLIGQHVEAGNHPPCIKHLHLFHPSLERLEKAFAFLAKARLSMDIQQIIRCPRRGFTHTHFVMAWANIADGHHICVSAINCMGMHTHLRRHTCLPSAIPAVPCMSSCDEYTCILREACLFASVLLYLGCCVCLLFRAEILFLRLRFCLGGFAD